MEKSKLISLKEKLESKSSKPWACFETNGISEEGLGVSMYWNKAFVEHLRDAGIQGINDQETLQLFFLYMASRIASSASEEDTVNPEATPTLTSDANRLVR